MEKKWVLMTNDDGIEAPGFEHLVKAMNRAGIPVVAFAPSTNKSACSMQLNLGQPIDLHNRNELIEQWNLDASVGVHLFALDGTPCDTMIVALDGGLRHVLPDVEPSIVLSGVNLGPNLSQDSYHSGTMGAAREAGLYGIPAIASSYTSFDPDGIQVGIDARLNFFNVFCLLFQRFLRTFVVHISMHGQNMFLHGQIHQLNVLLLKRINNL